MIGKSQLFEQECNILIHFTIDKILGWVAMAQEQIIPLQTRLYTLFHPFALVMNGWLSAPNACKASVVKQHRHGDQACQLLLALRAHLISQAF